MGELGDEREGTQKPKRWSKPSHEGQIIQCVGHGESTVKVCKVVGEKALKQYFSAHGDFFSFRGHLATSEDICLS